MGCAGSSSVGESAERIEVHPWSVDSDSGSSVWDNAPDEEVISLFYQYAVDKSKRSKKSDSDVAVNHRGSDAGERTSGNAVGHRMSTAVGNTVGKFKSMKQVVGEAFSRHQQAKSKSAFFGGNWGSRSSSLSMGDVPGAVEDDALKDYFLTVDHLASLANDLGFQDLGYDEIARIYANMPRDTNDKVGREQFAAAVKEGPGAITLRLLVRKLQKGFAYGFKMPEQYDFTKPTSENYKVDDREFSEEFERFRRGIDYTYHNNYTLERQRWQDEVIKSTIVRSSEQPAPWLVFTCGPMGVGKGYCMNWMSKHGFFPLENIVHVDPDAFKMMMPEWPKYVKMSGEEAGTLCHMESSLMMEIAQWAAMERRQNIWIDGSLRNADFYAHVFEDIRARFPHYKISIMYIYADEAIIRQRIQIRAERTGRNVPENLIQASLGAMDKALNKLTPLCDFVARIDNSGEVPALSAFATIDAKGSWGVLQNRFAHRASDIGDFPQSLAPLPLVRLPEKEAALFHHYPTSDELALRTDSDALPPSLKGLLNNTLLKSRKLFDFDPRKLMEQPVQDSSTNSLYLITSPTYRVTLSSHGRRLAGIPEEAESYFWVFPLRDRSDGAEMTPEVRVEPLLQFLFQGGFCYCSVDGKVLSVHAISHKREEMFMQFDSPQTLQKNIVQKMVKGGRFHPVAASYLRQRGATKFCWVMPDEIFGKVNVGGRHGAFAYLMEGQSNGLLFPVLSA
jgi:predicted ABC-type ATPase